jgi:hypothetical protein
MAETVTTTHRSGRQVETVNTTRLTESTSLVHMVRRYDGETTDTNHWIVRNGQFFEINTHRFEAMVAAA